MAATLCYLKFYVLTLFVGFSDSLNLETIENVSESCYVKGICLNGKGSRLHLSLDWSEKNCFCDDACIKYGDCCLEANAYDKVAMKTAYEDHDCVNVQPFGSFYMKGKCLDDWKDYDVYRLCHKTSSQFPLQEKDAFLAMPVTSVESDVTYKNFYCAICNNEPLQKLEVWYAQLSCSEDIGINETYLYEHIQYVDDTWGLYIETDGGDELFYTVDIYPIAPETVSDKVRHCKEAIGTCSSEWVDEYVREECHSYTALLYGPPPNGSLSQFEVSEYSSSNSIPYRNYHCAVCNFMDGSSLNCYERNFRQILPILPVSLSILFDFRKKSNCQSNEFWDPFYKVCRSFVCGKDLQFQDGKCEQIDRDISTGVNITANETELYTQNSHKLKCDKLFINQSDFTKGDNYSIIVNTFRRTYSRNEYEVYKEGILVCIPNNYSRLMGWLTFCGIGLSCVCITIHLITFLFVPDLRNLSGKNLASMCSALLVAYVCFLITSLKENGTNDCPILGSVMYYFFLSSFTWMNVMAFDVWRTLERATSELRLTSGKQWKKFAFYSAYAWVFPLFALIFVLALDHAQPYWIPPAYLPALGQRSCWFGQRKAILVYFAAPLAFIMLLNIFFFLLAVKMVSVTSRSTSNSRTCSTSNLTRLKLYLRLALLMGLSWISGIVAGYIQEEYMWYLFILLNAFQGVYILVGFTLTKKVFRAVKGTNSLRNSYRSGASKSSTSRQTLESHDSQLSNTSSPTIGTSIGSLSTKSGGLHSSSPKDKTTY